MGFRVRSDGDPLVGRNRPALPLLRRWQLVVNTATTIVTFLMVFLIQNTQNRDARAIHLKLDEIIRAIRPANNNMINIEKLSDEEMEILAISSTKSERAGSRISNINVDRTFSLAVHSTQNFGCK
jgi:low affinity Fe/Cu permease